MKYRICCKRKGTEYVEKGEAVLEKDDAQAIADALNLEWTESEHWVEPGEVEQ
jgi:hypothetical protein